MDSLDLNELSNDDRELIESSLKIFHNAKNDTSKIKSLSTICDNLNHQVWFKYQLIQKNLLEKSLKLDRSLAEKSFLSKRMASCLNNIAFFKQSTGDFNEAFEAYNKAIKLQKEHEDYVGLSITYNNLSIYFRHKGQLDKALKYSNKSIEIKRTINDSIGLATSLLNTGILLKDLGKIKEALSYFSSSLKLFEQIGDKRGISHAYQNIAFIYFNQKEYYKSIEHYKLSINYSEEIGDVVQLATCYSNLGLVYKEMGENDKANLFFKRAYEKAIKINDLNGQGYSLNNIGTVYHRQKEYDKALKEYLKALDISKELGNIMLMVNILNNLANLYIEKADYNKALNYGQEGYQLVNQIGHPELIRNASLTLSRILENKGNHKESLKHYKLHIQMRDSINNEETQKAAIRLQTQYEFEKVQAVKDKEHEKQLEVEQEAQEKQRIISYATAGGLGLTGVFLFIVMNRLKVTRKQKRVIEEQKEVVEEAHQEIQDSIAYAKRIQSAILPPAKLVKEYLKESFILYKPKDVVAGDFYWMEHKNNKVLFAAADCTGHGVPGAMVSVVCNNALNRSVREHGLTDPGEILTKAREIVIQEFEKSEEEVKDGMDIALCSIEGNKLQYAGAHNPLWIIRNGEIIETKANKQPIGQFDHQEPYITHSFDLEKGDSIYIFSDGYVDQFGGEKGKKFKAKAFRELLLSIQDKSMEEQKTIIDEAFETWKGDLEQIDDVCVIGVRV